MANGYGKRPILQWIVIYVLVGGLIYLAIYFLFFANGGGGGTPGY